MENVKKYVEECGELMAAAEEYIWRNPEAGYKEYKTNEYMRAKFTELGYAVEDFGDITGFTAYYDTGKEGPTVLVLAELDALYCSMHVNADKETGAAHVCGHNMQCAAALGVAATIQKYGEKFDLCGKVKFGIVPAEEGIDISYRTELVRKKALQFTSGKPECIARGLLNDVDMAFMIHIGNGENKYEGGYYFNKGSNGVLRKKVEIEGRAAHAGGKPWAGINALYAAQIALSACNALRETFKEEDYIRFHPIITKGGDSVNAIPDCVVMESYVRGANAKAIAQANVKINRAITGACLAMGAKVRITDLPGSEPRLDDENLTKLMQGVGAELLGTEKSVRDERWQASSTDMGDVTSLVPSVHGYVDGCRGKEHDKSYERIDPKGTCIRSACLQFGTIVELLKDGGKKCYEIKKNFKPVYASVEEYLTEKGKLSRDSSCIDYEGDKIHILL